MAEGITFSLVRTDELKTSERWIERANWLLNEEGTRGDDDSRSPRLLARAQVAATIAVAKALQEHNQAFEP